MITMIIAVVSFFTGAGVVGFIFISAGRKFRGMEAERVILDADQRKLAAETEEVRARKVALEEFERENAILKRDLLNIDVAMRKLVFDRELQAERQGELDARGQALAEKYLKETEKWVALSINANNYAAQKSRLVKAIEWCRSLGYDVPATREEQLLADLKVDFEKAVRVALEKEEQARIRAQIREEQARERDIARELQVLEREREAIQAALEKALADAHDQHSEEVERLRERLAEAEARNQRAISQAQLTKAGHIYVISNVGSFGEDVYKIGMTRRLEPELRIRELGDASVPFPFDIHMMISCDDAPALENKLHKQFHKRRVNKVNPRKEYFKVDLESVREFVVAHHGDVAYTADAEALEYRQTLEMSEQDQEYIEMVFDRAEESAGFAEVED